MTRTTTRIANRVAGSGLALMLLLGITCGQEPAKDEPESRPGSGPRELALELSLDRKRLAAGKTIGGRISLINHAERALRLPLQMDCIEAFDGSLGRAVRLVAVDDKGRHQAIGAFGNYNRGPDRIELQVPARGVLKGRVDALLGYTLAKGGTRKLLAPGRYRIHALLGDELGGWSRHTPAANRLRSNGVSLVIDQAAPKLEVKDLDWLTGSWIGGHDGTVYEETWSPPSGGSMLGTFRWLDQGRPRFYEFLLIEEDAEGAVLRFKHFSPGYRPWEKDHPITLRVSQEKKGRMILTNVKKGASPSKVEYRRSASGDLVVTIEEVGRDGKRRDLRLAFKRKS